MGDVSYVHLKCYLNLSYYILPLACVNDIEFLTVLLCVNYGWVWTQLTGFEYDCQRFHWGHDKENKEYKLFAKKIRSLLHLKTALCWWKMETIKYRSIWYENEIIVDQRKRKWQSKIEWSSNQQVVLLLT